MDTSRVGGIIRDRRKELKMSLEDIGKCVGVNKSTVMRWEKGDIANMRSTSIYLLSKALYLPIEVLLGLETDKPIEQGELIVKRLEVFEELKQVKTLEGLEEAKKYIDVFILKK